MMDSGSDHNKSNTGDFLDSALSSGIYIFLSVAHYHSHCILLHQSDMLQRGLNHAIDETAVISRHPQDRSKPPTEDRPIRYVSEPPA
jgi:hypothetical protein